MDNSGQNSYPKLAGIGFVVGLTKVMDSWLGIFCIYLEGFASNMTQ